MAELQTGEGRSDDFLPALNALIARAGTPQPERPVARCNRPAGGDEAAAGERTPTLRNQIGGMVFAPPAFEGRA
ncbi:MAG: hypothetical protein OEL78_01480 [Hyphomicrobiales bacterium]|nr:hypothetical protein [Hyphomicrobiales bacterium]